MSTKPTYYDVIQDDGVLSITKGDTGSKGDTGPSGGPKGDTGVKGDTGSIGTKGDTGIGAKGDTGAGIKGDTGISVKGDTGIGIKGDTGTIGGTGAKGDTGVGIKGDTGSGLKGDTGSGEKGDTGAGIKGDTGISVKGDTGTGGKGDTGVQGDTGVGEGTPGAKGDTGVQGDTGTGSKGDTGYQGDTGISIKGDTGIAIKGDTGIGSKGDTGYQGDTGVGEKGDTGSGVKGDTGIGTKGDTGVGDTGVGLKGDTGEVGDTGVGVKGDTGSIGDTGIGEQGDTGVGEKGDTGVGEKGDTGASGDTGTGLKGDTGSGEKGDTGVGAKGDTGVKGDTGAGIGGAIYITNIVAQNPGDNVSNKVYSSNNTVLESCLSNTDLVTASVIALVGRTNYIPSATINGNLITLTGNASSALCTGSLSFDTLHSTSLTVAHEDGASHSTAVTYDVGPAMTTLEFTGGYPGSQTELKAGDVFNLHVITATPMTRISVFDEEACVSQVFNFGSTLEYNASVVIANRGTTTQSLRARVKCMNASGSYGADGYTSNTVDLNNLYPSVSIGTVTYPSGQGALKDSETATVANTVTNFNTILYSSSSGEVTPSNATTYETSKTVTRAGGTYNIATNNLTIVATRSANAASTTTNGVVKIANTLPTIAVSVPGNQRLRSGGNDGTSAQDYTVTITATQILNAAPTMDLGVGGGTWQGAGFAGSGTTWTRTVRITDAMTKGNYTFINVSAFNLANKEQTSIGSGSAYVLGGFVQRTLNLEAFANTTVMNVEAVTYPSKVTMVWTVKSLPTKSAVGTTAPPPVAGAWCISALNTNPTTVVILDTEATNASSELTTLTIEEAV